MDDNEDRYDRTTEALRLHDSVRGPARIMATQACTRCREKKTKCDEGQPCSLCESMGIECHYIKRKPTRKEITFSTILNAVRRVESKVDEIRTERRPRPSKSSDPSSDPNHRESLDAASLVTSSQHTFSKLDPDSTPISFSQHAMLNWPVIRDQLPWSTATINSSFDPKYVVATEYGRPTLPMERNGDRWLFSLPLSLITSLSTAYFDTFNPNTPVMEKDVYFGETINVIIREGFGYNIESCLVLNVLALGCLAVGAHQEGNFSMQGVGSLHSDVNCEEPFSLAPDWLHLAAEDLPGLRFFNESRKRSGLLPCNVDISFCQYYLLSSMYYMQIIRPTDAWSMVNRACTNCLAIVKSGRVIKYDEWAGDIFSRIYWSCLMLETILTQELDLPDSGLREVEHMIPLPKFISFQPTKESTLTPSRATEHETFYQFHFLAQIAHRIILTRVKTTLFFYSEKRNSPSPALLQELYFQHDQWRLSLPPIISFEDNDEVPVPTSPAHAVATGMLHSRWKIAKFHIARPFLYKALHKPHLMTEIDLQTCHDGLSAAMNWPAVVGIRRAMFSCLPLKFAFCSQFFGQLLLFWAISRSPDKNVRLTLPLGYKEWCRTIIGFLEECKTYSVAVKADMEILEKLGVVEFVGVGS
ncbi:C6 finger domain protein [Cadophora sp. MPI-SDFR-AT-0126]|nr:C6 finger domain protein [Leotiomycetes sp. MPI-SDFR-AT-0126]